MQAGRFAALRAGASGSLLKDAAPADLLAGIRVVVAGDALAGFCVWWVRYRRLP